MKKYLEILNSVEDKTLGHIMRGSKYEKQSLIMERKLAVLEQVKDTRAIY